MELKLEAKPIKDKTPTLKHGNGMALMITPPISEDYWLARVAVSDKQAIIAFPKFGTIGIGFQHEEDWNTNLPYSCDAAKIYSHIEHNKGDGAIPSERCVEAIKMLQAYAAAVKEAA
jgi:hypothetical protein